MALSFVQEFDRDPDCGCEFAHAGLEMGRARSSALSGAGSVMPEARLEQATKYICFEVLSWMISSQTVLGLGRGIPGGCD